MADELGLLIPKKEVVALKPFERKGGTEHYIFVKGHRIYKLTKPSGWGLMGNPGNYLKSIATFAKIAPQLDTRVEGVFMNDGIPTVLTSYKYIAGEHPKADELRDYLQSKGWRPKYPGDLKSHYYVHTSGVEMIDAHSQNFIKTGDGKIYPVDVHFRDASAEVLLRAGKREQLFAGAPEKD